MTELGATVQIGLKIIAKFNIFRVHIGFKYPSKNTINTKLAGMRQGVLPGI